jgi:hypothetical protein
VLKHPFDMGVCVFVASGLGFDVDSYLKKCPFKPAAVFRRGTVPAKETVPRPDSGFVVAVADRAGLGMEDMAEAALTFLSNYEQEFSALRKCGADNLLLDFGVERSGQIQDSHYLAPDVVSRLAGLGFGLMFSSVQFPSG